MIRLSPHFKAFLRLLKSRQIEYLLVGGYAVQYYGYLRPTSDLDIWIAANRVNAQKLVEALQSFGTGIAGLTLEPFQHENRIIRIEVQPLIVEVLNPIIGQRPESLSRIEGNPAGLIEVLTIQSGVSFETCYPERVMDRIDGVEVSIISLHHLEVVKQAGNRPQDIDDLAHLIETRNRRASGTT